MTNVLKLKQRIFLLISVKISTILIQKLFLDNVFCIFYVDQMANTHQCIFILAHKCNNVNNKLHL